MTILTPIPRLLRGARDARLDAAVEETSPAAGQTPNSERDSVAPIHDATIEPQRRTEEEREYYSLSRRVYAIFGPSTTP